MTVQPNVTLPDPAAYTNRACKGVPQSVFFPRPNSNDVAAAQQVCRRCPRLRVCAEWAVPMVESAALTGCVIAAVNVPGAYRSHKARKAAVDELRAVARGCTAPAESGAA